MEKVPAPTRAGLSAPELFNYYTIWRAVCLSTSKPKDHVVLVHSCVLDTKETPIPQSSANPTSLCSKMSNLTPAAVLQEPLGTRKVTDQPCGSLALTPFALFMSPEPSFPASSNPWGSTCHLPRCSVSQQTKEAPGQSTFNFNLGIG